MHIADNPDLVVLSQPRRGDPTKTLGHTPADGNIPDADPEDRLGCARVDILPARSRAADILHAQGVPAHPDSRRDLDPGLVLSLAHGADTLRPMLHARALASFVLLTSPILAQGVPQDGQDAPSQADETPGVLDWEYRLQAQAWFAALNGDLRLPGGSGQVTFDELDLDEPGVRPFVDLDLRRGNWRFNLNAAGFDEEASTSARMDDSIAGIAFASGDTLRSSIQYVTVEGSAGYNIWDYVGGTTDTGGHRVESQVEIVGGVRFTSIDIDIEIARAGSPVGTASASEVFGEPFIGVRWSLGLFEAFAMETQTNIGGFSTGGDRESASWDIRTQMSWRPNGHFGALFGYRQLMSDLSAGSGDRAFDYFGAGAGLYAGLELRF